MTPIHALPLGGRGDHRLDRACPCGVVAGADIAQPAQIVFIHRSPPSGAREWKLPLHGDPSILHSEGIDRILIKSKALELDPPIAGPRPSPAHKRPGTAE